MPNMCTVYMHTGVATGIHSPQHVATIHVHCSTSCYGVPKPGSQPPPQALKQTLPRSIYNKLNLNLCTNRKAAAITLSRSSSACVLGAAAPATAASAPA